MSQNFFKRLESTRSKDFYPTPPWATRALFEHVMPEVNKGLSEWLPGSAYNRDMTCLEPACGTGYMSKVLNDYFHGVDAYDIEDYGYGLGVQDFLKMPNPGPIKIYDWVITNPPFGNELPMKFVKKAKDIAKHGIAIFARIQLLEGKNRYNSLFSRFKPVIIAPFTERVTLIKNQITRKRISTTCYAWFVWNVNKDSAETKVVWIPPGAQRNLERMSDYNGQS